MPRSSKGKQQAFTAFVRPHLDRLYSLAFRLTGSRDDAQDLVQEVMLKVYPQVDRMADIDEPRTWLGRILFNQFVDTRRRTAARRLHLVDNSAFSDNPDLAESALPETEQQASGELDMRRIQAALARLSEKHRIIINLHDIEGYTLAEIVDITGIPHGTLKSRRQRARERLQEILQIDGPVQSPHACRQDRGEENDELRSVS